MHATSDSLRILPLHLLQNIVPQKCLLPVTVFPADVEPGAWSKCILVRDSSDTAGSELYAVCQIYPRADIQCCYLDNCVASAQLQLDNQILAQLELLDEVPQVSELNLVFTITEQVLRKKRLTRSKLQELAQFMLQEYMLVPGCCVQSENLQSLGVASISIANAEGCADGECFKISATTTINIFDVRLVQSATVEAIKFHSIGFEKPLQQLNDLLLLLCNAKRPKGLPLNALIVGAAGSGKSALLTEFIRRKQCNCYRITAGKVLGQYAGETEAAIRQIFEAAIWFSKQLRPNSPIIVLIEDLHLLCPATKSNATDASTAMRISAQLLALVDELTVSDADIMCLATTNAPETLNANARRAGRFEYEIILSTPTEQQRKLLFKAFFDDHFANEALDDTLLNRVAQQTQGYIAADLALLVRSMAQCRLMTPDTHISEIVRVKLQQAQPSSIRSTDVCIYKPTSGFECIGGMQKLKRTLEVAVLAGLQNEVSFKRFGLSLPKGVLLYGPPGCAKTTVAKCLAKEANMTFIATSGAEVYSPYIGCAERFIAKIFDAARKNAPCLIFLDEIDALVGRRGLGTVGGGDVQLRILSTLLTEMDGIVGGGTTAGGSPHHILVVAATNRPDMIDDALMRPGRFDKLIHVPAPDYASRLALLQLYAQRMPFAPNVDLAQIAADEHTANYSGADLCNLCNEAALHALQRNFDAGEINLDDFMSVLLTQKPSLTQKQIDWHTGFEQRFQR